MERIPSVIKGLIILYFYAVLFRFLFFSQTGRRPRHKLLQLLFNLTDPYLNIVKSLCRGLMRLYYGLIALLFLVWAENFFPPLLSFILSGISAAPVNTGEVSAEISAAGVIGAIMFYSFLVVIKSALFFFAIISLLYFILLLSRLPINHPFTGSVMLTIEPLLSPLRRVMQLRTRTDWIPLIFAGIMFAGYIFL